MPTETISGSCLCGSVSFTIAPPIAAFGYCHCRRCQKTTGSGHAANIFVLPDQFAWIAGEQFVKQFDLPGAKRFAVAFCTTCGSRVPHVMKGGKNVLIPAGVLDTNPIARPDFSIFWDSRAPWYVETPGIPKHSEYAPSS